MAQSSSTLTGAISAGSYWDLETIRSATMPGTTSCLGARSNTLNGGDTPLIGAGNGSNGNGTTSYFDSAAGVTVTVQWRQSEYRRAGTDSLSNMGNLVGPCSATT